MAPPAFADGAGHNDDDKYTAPTTRVNNSERGRRAPAGAFGPQVQDVPEAARRAALRALAALTAVFAGSDNRAVDALRHAELDTSTSDRALAMFDKLPALPRRRIISVYAAVMYPRQRGGGAS